MLGHLGAVLGHIGSCEAILGYVGANLGLSWATCDHLEDVLGDPGAILGPSWGHLGAILGHYGPKREPNLVPFWAPHGDGRPLPAAGRLEPC